MFGSGCRGVDDAIIARRVTDTLALPIAAVSRTWEDSRRQVVAALSVHAARSTSPGQAEHEVATPRPGLALVDDGCRAASGGVRPDDEAIVERGGAVPNRSRRNVATWPRRSDRQASSL